MCFSRPKSRIRVDDLIDGLILQIMTMIKRKSSARAKAALRAWQMGYPQGSFLWRGHRAIHPVSAFAFPNADPRRGAIRSAAGFGTRRA
jgi:hypothetical protein